MPQPPSAWHQRGQADTWLTRAGRWKELDIPCSSLLSSGGDAFGVTRSQGKRGDGSALQPARPFTEVNIGINRASLTLLNREGYVWNSSAMHEACPGHPV